ncbi:hypothetical protein G6F55_014146 [Rhizopus delemar]|nr:hypothetical protein G6F55_014146 [Rhizopus delemar]
MLAGLMGLGDTAAIQDAQIGVVRQIGRVEGVAQPAPQPGTQPAVVLAIQAFDARWRTGGIGNGQGSPRARGAGKAYAL